MMVDLPLMPDVEWNGNGNEHRNRTLHRIFKLQLKSTLVIPAVKDWSDILPIALHLSKGQ